MITVSGEDISEVHVTKMGAYAVTASDCARDQANWRASTLDYWRKVLPPQPATWDGSVLPALRAALDAYPETRGAEVSHRLHDGTGMLTAEARRPGAWVVTKAIRLGCHQYMAEDVATMVGLAIGCARDYVPPKPCPVCAVQIVRGVRCEACRVSAARAADMARGELAYADREVETMPLQPAEPVRRPDPAIGPGDRVILWAEAGSRFMEYDGREVRVTRMLGESPSGWWAAVELHDGVEAAWPLSRMHLADESTPLPDGWTWDEDYQCVADGPELPHNADLANEYAGLDWDGTVFTHDDRPAPPAVHNALVREARRLGLVCDERLVVDE